MGISKAELKRRLEEYDLTDFQRDVLYAAMEIPKGETWTYKKLAGRSGHESAYRAVGSVMKMNPLAPMIPCHRVVRSNGELGNYSAPGGASMKRRLLKMEKAI